MNPVLPEQYRKEHVFIREIFYEPEDYSARMIYADWLEEHQDQRSELLRIDLELQSSEITDEHRNSIQRRRTKLLNRTNRQWATLLAMAAIEKCPAELQLERDEINSANALDENLEAEIAESVIEFRFKCPKRWENLIPTDENEQIRFCNECQKSVHFCTDIYTAREHAQRGNCVALDLSVIRKPHDLDFTFDMDELTLGIMSE